MRREIMVRLRKRMRLGEVARDLKTPYAYVQKVARSSGEPYVGRQLSDQQDREIKRLREDEGLTIRAIAARMRLPKSKIGRAVQAQYNRVVASGGTEVSPTQLREPRRCPVHGLVRLWPCIACQAETRKRLFMANRNRR